MQQCTGPRRRGAMRFGFMRQRSNLDRLESEKLNFGCQSETVVGTAVQMTIQIGSGSNADSSPRCPGKQRITARPEQASRALATAITPGLAVLAIPQVAV